MNQLLPSDYDHIYSKRFWTETTEPNGTMVFQHTDNRLRIELRPNADVVQFVVLSSDRQLVAGSHVYRDLTSYVNEFVYNGCFTQLLGE